MRPLSRDGDAHPQEAAALAANHHSAIRRNQTASRLNIVTLASLVNRYLSKCSDFKDQPALPHEALFLGAEPTHICLFRMLQPHELASEQGTLAFSRLAHRQLLAYLR